MIAGFHLVWTAYGWWLPNDPRGSWSDEVRVEPLAALGEAHYGRKAVQPSRAELRRFYEAARDILKHPLLTFTDEDVALVAASFADVIATRKYTCYACAIMPDHVHLLIRKHRDHAETMSAALQDASRQAVILAGRRSGAHPVWGGKGWKGFLNTVEDMRRTVAYIANNPIKAGLRPQSWPFVKPYNGWLPGRYR
jgi:REP element-mobilizing transposase RayT